MVMVPGERRLELTLAVARNYSVPQLQPANLQRAGPNNNNNNNNIHICIAPYGRNFRGAKGSKHVIT